MPLKRVDLTPEHQQLRNNFQDLSDILTGKVADILFVSETELDSSFTQAQFEAPGYRSFRNPWRGYSGEARIVVSINFGRVGVSEVGNFVRFSLSDNRRWLPTSLITR